MERMKVVRLASKLVGRLVKTKVHLMVHLTDTMMGTLKELS